MARFSAHWFTLGSSLGYIILLALNAPLVLYYPLDGTWTVVRFDEGVGPEMHWYGLLLGAAAIGLLCSAIPAKLFKPSVQQHIAWIPVFAMLAAALLLRGFFGTG